MRAWRVRRRWSTGCGSGRGLCCWRRTAWRAERSDGRLDVQPARRRSGGCVTPRSGLRVSTKRASGALSRSHTTATNKRILALLDQTPPEGYARWTGPAHRCLHQGLQHHCRSVCLDQVRGPSKTPQTTFRAVRLALRRRLPEPIGLSGEGTSAAFSLPACIGEPGAVSSERHHDFRPQVPLRRSALLRRVSRCLGLAWAATMYLFHPSHLHRQ